MPERLDKVTIQLTTRAVTLPWDTAQALFAQLDPMGFDYEVGQQIRAAFQAVGTSRPITLTLEQKSHLLNAIETWSLGAPRGLDTLGEEIKELRGALYDDLHDTEQRGGS